MTTPNKFQTIFSGLATCFAVGGLALLTSCGGGDDHDHDHDHGDDGGHEHAEGDHDHGHGEEGDHDHATGPQGPNGGRILTEVEPHLEFLLTDDHKVQIGALTEDAKPAPIGAQIITVTGGDRSSPADLSFTKEGDVLVSNVAFPKGKNLPVIVQIQTSAEAEPVFARFSLNLSDCPDCDLKEYACVCAHAH